MVRAMLPLASSSIVAVSISPVALPTLAVLVKDDVLHTFLGQALAGALEEKPEFPRGCPDDDAKCLAFARKGNHLDDGIWADRSRGWHPRRRWS